MPGGEADVLIVSGEADVLIVGGGPVGLTLAADLSCREVSSIVLERNPTTSNSPKAFGLNQRSLEHFRRMGLEKNIQDASYPRDLKYGMSIRTGLVGNSKNMFEKMFSSWGDVLDGKVKGEHTYFQEGVSPTFLMLCPSFSSEAVLSKHIQDTSEYAKLHFGWCVTAVSQDDSGVTVKAVNENGDEKMFRGKYLAACDGGRSFMRKELGLHTYGHFALARSCTISFSSPQLKDQMMASKRAGFTYVLNAQISCVAALLTANGRFVIHVLLPANTSDEEVRWYVENPNKCIELVIGSSKVPYDIVTVDSYNMHGLISTRYQKGRCFLAGDSAHQWMPVGGLGLNTGIADASDLSWKMAAMVKGYGGKYLLDSYEIERRPHADTSRRFSINLSNAGISRSAVQKLRPLLIGNPIFRYLLGKIMGRVIMRQRSGSIAIGVILGFQYRNSNVIMHQYDEDGSVIPPCNIGSNFSPASLPGCRAPHVVLSDSPSTLDLFGKSFVLITIGGAETDLVELREALAQKGVPFSAHTYPPLPELTQLYNRKYFLIRPDGVVAWRSDFQPSNAESLKIVATVLGHLPNPRLPPPIDTYSEPGTPAMQSFARDVTVRLVMTGLLAKYTRLPLVAAGSVGLGMFMLLRALSIAPPFCNVQSTSRHKAVIVSKYGGADAVLKLDPKHVGKFGPDDVLIHVHAASVTQLDVLMRSGCGAILYQKMSSRSPCFPLVLGRGCSGEVVAVGDNVTSYFPGDQVYAAIPPNHDGAHAQLVGVHESNVAFKPSNMDHKEAAALPWAAMTVWSALVGCAGLNQYNTRGKKVLVHNGTGPEGSIAVQLLKAWGANVTTTCAIENITLVRNLGADKVLADQTGNIFTVQPRDYDIVLDTSSDGKFEHVSLSILKYYQRSIYIATTSPHGKLVDSCGGFLGGIVFSTLYRLKVIFNRLFGGRGFYYSNTQVSTSGLDEMRGLVEQGAVRPLIDSVYSLDEVMAAHKLVEGGNTRGGVVISLF